MRTNAPRVSPRSAIARRAPAELQVQTVGRPVALSSLARLLLAMHQPPPPLRLVHDQPRDPVPALKQGP